MLLRISSGGFEPLRHSEQAGDGVPVSACARRLQDLFDEWEGQLGAPLSVGEIDVKLTSDDPQFLRADFDSKELIAGFGVGIAGEEDDQELAGMGCGLRRKRV